MASDSWADVVGEDLGSRLSAATAVIRAAAALGGAVAGCAVVVDISGWASRLDGALGWATLAVVLVMAYATPLAYIPRQRARALMRSRLEIAGVDVTGAPPAGSVSSFQRWLEQNQLDPAVVRRILSGEPD